MSGWFGRMFWKAAYKKLPAGVSDVIQKAGDTFDEIEGKNPKEQHPTMPQSTVNKEFQKKERRFHGPPNRR